MKVLDRLLRAASLLCLALVLLSLTSSDAFYDRDRARRTAERVLQERYHIEQVDAIRWQPKVGWVADFTLDGKTYIAYIVGDEVIDEYAQMRWDYPLSGRLSDECTLLVVRALAARQLPFDSVSCQLLVEPDAALDDIPYAPGLVDADVDVSVFSTHWIEPMESTFLNWCSNVRDVLLEMDIPMRSLRLVAYEPGAQEPKLTYDFPEGEINILREKMELAP